MATNTTNERFDTVLRRRAEGETFCEIGEALGITAGRANQLHGQALAQSAKTARWSDELPTGETPIERLKLSDRTYKALSSEGFRTLSELMPLDENMLRKLIALPNFGRGQWNKLKALIHSF